MVLPRQRCVNFLSGDPGASQLYTHVVSSAVAGVERVALLPLWLASSSWTSCIPPHCFSGSLAKSQMVFSELFQPSVGYFLFLHGMRYNTVKSKVLLFLKEWLNKCLSTNAFPQVMLSHRWQQLQDSAPLLASSSFSFQRSCKTPVIVVNFVPCCDRTPGLPCYRFCDCAYCD